MKKEPAEQVANNLEWKSGVQAESNFFGRLCFWLMMIFLVTILLVIRLNNKLEAHRLSISEKAKNLCKQLQSQRDILIEVFEELTAHPGYERMSRKNIEKLRSLVVKKEHLGHCDQEIRSLFEELFAMSDKAGFPTSEKIRKSIAKIIFTEEEIQVSRRLYNLEVTDFNSLLITWPTNVWAARKKLSTVSLFGPFESETAFNQKVAY